MNRFEPNSDGSTLYRRVLDSLSSHVGLIASDGSIQFVNEALADLVDHDRADLLDGHFLGLVHDADAGRVEHLLTTGAEEGGEQYAKIGLQCSTGETISANLELSSIHDGGSFVGHFVKLTPVEKESDDQTDTTGSQRFETLVSVAPLSIVVINADGTIESWNRAAEQMFGWTESDVIGRTPPFVPTEMDVRWQSIRERVLVGDSVTDVEMGWQTMGGGLIDVRLSAAPLYEPDGRVDGMLVVVTDITQHREREQRLGVLDRVLRHNMRNDMNVIMGHAELLRGETERNRIEESTDVIKRKAQQVVELANEAREIESILSDQYDVHQLDIVSVVEGIADEYAETYPEADITLHGDDTAQVYAVDSIDLAVENLVENAIEHNDTPEPNVDISVSCSWDDRDWIEVRVADDGPGIPKQEREVLKGTESPLNHASSLGLWLVQWIVRRSAGELTFSKNEPRGSVATVRLRRGENYTSS